MTNADMMGEEKREKMNSHDFYLFDGKEDFNKKCLLLCTHFRIERKAGEKKKDLDRKKAGDMKDDEPVSSSAPKKSSSSCAPKNRTTKSGRRRSNGRCKSNGLAACESSGSSIDEEETIFLKVWSSCHIDDESNKGKKILCKHKTVAYIVPRLVKDWGALTHPALHALLLILKSYSASPPFLSSRHASKILCVKAIADLTDSKLPPQLMEKYEKNRLGKRKRASKRTLKAVETQLALAFGNEMNKMRLHMQEKDDANRRIIATLEKRVRVLEAAAQKRVRVREAAPFIKDFMAIPTVLEELGGNGDLTLHSESGFESDDSLTRETLSKFPSDFWDLPRM